MRNTRRVFAMSVIALSCASSVFAATPVDLSHQSPAILSAFATQESSMQQLSSSVDFNKVTHVRMQQMYHGYPVWGGDAIAHVANAHNATVKSLLAGSAQPNTTMNGIFYQNLTADLASAPHYIFDASQANRAVQQATDTYQNQSGNKNAVKDAKANLMVYIDEDNKAHYAFLVSFTTQTNAGVPAKPNYILDAASLQTYQTWDNIQTLDETQGGGFGGNERVGEFSYDGLGSDLPELTIQRDAANHTCYLQNKDVTVKTMLEPAGDGGDYKVAHFDCSDVDNKHNSEYWDADFDAVNGGYSPANDALFVGKVIKEMYNKWYGIPALITPKGEAMTLNMLVHKAAYDNAFWDGNQMTFGDGETMFYPLVSLGVGAHEISHGFTQQHSNLIYYGQSGGLNEAFSDMAAQAAEFYAYGHNSWQIGPEIFKEPNQALRYMDQPSRDCKGGWPGWNCSIDTAKQYNFLLNVHHSSGVFNHFFYILATSPNWDTKKAFDVMVKANMNYWTSMSSFTAAACGVVKATKDYKYDMVGVKTAANVVKIDISKC